MAPKSLDNPRSNKESFGKVKIPSRQHVGKNARAPRMISETKRAGFEVTKVTYPGASSEVGLRAGLRVGLRPSSCGAVGAACGVAYPCQGGQGGAASWEGRG